MKDLTKLVKGLADEAKNRLTRPVKQVRVNKRTKKELMVELWGFKRRVAMGAIKGESNIAFVLSLILTRYSNAAK